MAALVCILTIFTNELTKEERQLVAPQLLKSYRNARNIMIASALLFLVTMAPQFWTLRIQDIPVRFLLWLVLLTISGLARFPELPKLDEKNQD